MGYGLTSKGNFLCEFEEKMLFFMWFLKRKCCFSGFSWTHVEDEEDEECNKNNQVLMVHH